MSMDGRYAATAGVIAVFRNANSLAFRRYHASGGSRIIVAAAEQRASRASHLKLLLIQPFALVSVE
jgi:hypothetical protein